MIPQVGSHGLGARLLITSAKRDQAGTWQHWKRGVEFIFWDMWIVRSDTDFSLPQCGAPASGGGTKTAVCCYLPQLRTSSSF